MSGQGCPRGVVSKVWKQGVKMCEGVCVWVCVCMCVCVSVHLCGVCRGAGGEKAALVFYQGCVTMLCVVDRATCDVMVKGVSLKRHSNNPTHMAVQCLCTGDRFTKPMMDSFFEAGGVAAMVRLVREPLSPETLGHIALLVHALVLYKGSAEETYPEGRRLAAKLYESGGCFLAFRPTHIFYLDGPVQGTPELCMLW